MLHLRRPGGCSGQKERAMKKWSVATTALAFGAVAAVAPMVQAADAPPPWAYGFSTPVLPGTPPAEPNPEQVLDNITTHTLPGSAR
jgi:hypothetical protein